ncbi:uncharacterized protein LOC112682056 isoform X2 [Sipha flava]|nr:uncharacterized protein LOC112682056 isoform X2 [Sipha flava]
MYKSTYQKEFYWPIHVSKSNNHEVEPGFTLISKLNEDEFKQLYSTKIICRKLSKNKGIEPPLEYSNGVLPEFQDEELTDREVHPKSLYQKSFINRMPSQVYKKEETLEEWSQKWKNECHNVRDADDLVQALADQIINTQKTKLNRKRIGDV